MYGGREALPDDHKFRGQRGRVRARYRRPQLGRGTEKTGETSQRTTNLQLASGAFSCKVAPFTPAGERTKKASLTIPLSSALPHRTVPHLDQVCIVDQPVKNAIGECRIADLFMPARDRQLRSEERRAHLVAVLADRHTSES